MGIRYVRTLVVRSKSPSHPIQYIWITQSVLALLFQPRQRRIKFGTVFRRWCWMHQAKARRRGTPGRYVFLLLINSYVKFFVVRMASNRRRCLLFQNQIYVDHVTCYRSAGCPCGPATFEKWIGVTTVPLSCSAIRHAIYTFGRCSNCSIFGFEHCTCLYGW